MEIEKTITATFPNDVTVNWDDEGLTVEQNNNEYTVTKTLDSSDNTFKCFLTFPDIGKYTITITDDDNNTFTQVITVKPSNLTFPYYTKIVADEYVRDRLGNSKEYTLSSLMKIIVDSNDEDLIERYEYNYRLGVFNTNLPEEISESIAQTVNIIDTSCWRELEGETLTFTGTKLPCNAVNERETGEYWVQYFMGWGYVDNRPDYAYGYVSGSQQSNQNLGFNIEWAVDEAGTSVHLAQVDFIKVYSAMLQQCGWLGETSTEVCGGIDLHPDAVAEPEPAVAGDLNGDATVDVDDMNLIINIIVGKNQEASLKALADLNADGTVDVDDMNALINIILHKG